MYNGRHKETMKNQVLAPPTLMGKYDITLDKQIISYTLKRSFKAKLIWLDIKRKTGLTVTIPYSYDVKYLPEYLKSNSKWIIRNLDKYCHEIPASPVNNTSSRKHNILPRKIYHSNAGTK